MAGSPSKVFIQYAKDFQHFPDGSCRVEFEGISFFRNTFQYYRDIEPPFQRVSDFLQTRIPEIQVRRLSLRNVYLVCGLIIYQIFAGMQYVRSGLTCRNYFNSTGLQIHGSLSVFRIIVHAEPGAQHPCGQILGVHDKRLVRMMTTLNQASPFSLTRRTVSSKAF